MTDVNAALQWTLEPGVWVFPCRANKAPWTNNGFYGATAEPEYVKKYWELWPSANVGVPTGRYPEGEGPAAFDVLDIDVKPGGSGYPSYKKLKSAGLLAGAMREVRTPSGGLHVYFVASEHPSVALRGKFIDYKAVGGYILVPPSHVLDPGKGLDGKYELITEYPSRNWATLDWSACLEVLGIEQWKEPDPTAPRAPWTDSNTQRALARIYNAPAGERHTTILAVCASLAFEGLLEQYWDDVLYVATNAPDPISESEVRNILRWTLNKVQPKPASEA